MLSYFNRRSRNHCGVFSQTTWQLDAWLLHMSTGGPCTKNMWFSSLRLLASEAGRTLVKACKDWKRMKKDHQIIPIEVEPFFWMIGWPGVGSCPERDLHCGAQLLQKRLLWRCLHGRCHRGGVVLQVLDRSCLSGALQSAGPGQSFGDQPPRDALEFGQMRYWSRRHQGPEPGVGSGFRCRSVRRWTKTLPAPDSSGFFDPQHLLFCRST